METGYIFLNLKPGEKRDFLTKINKVTGVKEARIVVGMYDAVVKIEDDTIEGLEKIYFNEIDKIDGIQNSRFRLVACLRSRK